MLEAKLRQAAKITAKEVFSDSFRVSELDNLNFYLSIKMIYDFLEVRDRYQVETGASREVATKAIMPNRNIFWASKFDGRLPVGLASTKYLDLVWEKGQELLGSEFTVEHPCPNCVAVPYVLGKHSSLDSLEDVAASFLEVSAVCLITKNEDKSLDLARLGRKHPNPEFLFSRYEKVQIETREIIYKGIGFEHEVKRSVERAKESGMTKEDWLEETLV